MMHMKQRLLFFFILLFSMPQESLAFERSVLGISRWIRDLVFGPLMPLLFAAALLWFIWGIAEFIRSADNSDGRERGKRRMLWGILALFFMITFLGITTIFTQTLFNDRPFLPQLHTN